MSDVTKDDLRAAMRMIATNTGLIGGGVKAFRTTYDEYVALLAPQFPEIAASSANGTLSLDYLNKILNGLKSGAVASEPVATEAPPPARTPVRAPAAAAAAPVEPEPEATTTPRRRGPGKKNAPAPAEEPASPPAEAAPSARTPVAAAAAAPTEASAPARRAPGGLRRPGAPAPVEVPTTLAAPSGELFDRLSAQIGDLKERVDYLGAATDENAKASGALKSVMRDLESLEGRVDHVAAAVTWMYNQFCEGDEIASIDELAFDED